MKGRRRSALSEKERIDSVHDIHIERIDRKTSTIFMTVNGCHITAVCRSDNNPEVYHTVKGINDFVSSEEVIFPRAETGGLDFSLIRPTGISLKLLKKMLQVGYLAKDNVQSIWRRIENTQYS